MLASLNFVDSFPGPPFLLELRTFIQRICCLPGFFLIFLDHFLLPFSPQKDIEFDVFLMENVEENMQCSPLCPLFLFFLLADSDLQSDVISFLHPCFIWQAKAVI